MRYIVDLHIHSRFARACSKNLNLPNIAAWAKAKGIEVIGTSDFTHPAWFAEIREQLEPAEPGMFKLKKQYDCEGGEGSYEAAPIARDARDMRYVISTEVSCIYSKGGKVRRIHLLVYVPSMDAAAKFNSALEAEGCNLRADGRPILGMDARDIVKIALAADPSAVVIPAHAWTPWFSLFGSKSGFDSIEECFEEYSSSIRAIETGLSSDPAMNHLFSKLDGITLISNSDAHSVRNLGREANVLDLPELSYSAIMDVIQSGDKSRFMYTIEFFPEEGMYHVDGHRACEFYCEPEETARLGGICPKCGKPLTRGVLGRVHALADRKAPPPGFVGYRSIVPLEELLADALGKGKGTKTVAAQYRRVVEQVGSEFSVLLDAPIEAIAEASKEAAEAVRAMREGRLHIRPGYDGVYGEVHVAKIPQLAQSNLGL